jgi:HEAT repeat protein
MNAHEYADLEIALSHHSADQCRVELRFRRPGSDLVQSDDPVLATFDPDQFGGLDDPRAVEPLIAALLDENDVMRRGAAGALQRIGTLEALAALERRKQ